MKSLFSVWDFVQEYLKDNTQMSAILVFKVKAESKEEGLPVKDLSEQRKLTQRNNERRGKEKITVKGKETAR
jgi:hypothetical protein